jgi:hypothetical protein
MRSASTTERTEQIILKQTSPNARSAVKLEIDINKDGDWEVINDLDSNRGINWTESGKKEKYANYATTPLPGTVSFEILNESGKYSDGSGTSFEGIIDKETKVRLSAGQILDTLGDEVSEVLNLNDTTGLLVGSYYYHTEYTGPYVNVIDTTPASTPTHFSDKINLYDSINYDESTYSIDAYSIHTYDAGGSSWNQVQDVVVNCNNTSGIIYYRSFNDHNIVGSSRSSDWTSAGATVNGDKTITISTESRFLQIAVVYDGITWGGDLRLNSVTVNYKSYVEFIYRSVYYLDRPSYSDPPSPQYPMIKCTGRDAYKKAVATDVNIRNLVSTGSGEYIDDLIKEVSDQIGILYDASSIADLTSFPLRTLDDGIGVVKADRFYEYCMQIINTVGYQMYLQYDDTLEDNILYIQLKPSTADASGAFNYKNYISINDVSKNSDRILQRMTVVNKKESINDEGLLVDQDISTTGSKVLSWATGNREYKRIVIDKPDDITINNFEANPNSITFDVDAVTGTVNFLVYGSAWNSTPTSEGEAFDIDNHVDGEGVTADIENPLIISVAEAKDIAESYIGAYGNPSIEARGLTWPYLYLLPQINDLFMLWRRYIFTNDVFFITKISHYWNEGKNPNEFTTYNLDDTGLDRADPTWDDDITQWDKGWVWDMGISSPLNSQAEIDIISDNLTVYDVDCS